MAEVSTSDGDVATGVVWEWWMLVLIGYAATAAAVGLIVGMLCLVWRCRQARSVPPPSVSRGEADTTPRYAVHRSHPLPSALSRTASLGDCALAQTAASPSASHSALHHSFGFTAWLERSSVDGGDAHASSTAAEGGVARGNGEEAGVDGAACAGLSADRRRVPPEDLFVAVTSCESPSKRLQRNRSIASHMDVGLSQEESLRLHLMRHADTSDPFFGNFVKSSRGKR